MYCSLCKRKLSKGRTKTYTEITTVCKPRAIWNSYITKNLPVHTHCKKALLEGTNFQEFTKEFHEVKDMIKNAAGHGKPKSNVFGWDRTKPLGKSAQMVILDDVKFNPFAMEKMKTFYEQSVKEALNIELFGKASLEPWESNPTASTILEDIENAKNLIMGGNNGKNRNP